MRKKRQMAPTQEVVELFDECGEAVFDSLGEGAFRVRGLDGRVHRQVNKALFDSIMVPTAFCDRRALVREAAGVRALRETLLADDAFRASIGRATTDRARMMQRIRRFVDGLRALNISVDLPDLDG